MERRPLAPRPSQPRRGASPGQAAQWGIAAVAQSVVDPGQTTSRGHRWPFGILRLQGFRRRSRRPGLAAWRDGHAIENGGPLPEARKACVLLASIRAYAYGELSGPRRQSIGARPSNQGQDLASPPRTCERRDRVKLYPFQRHRYEGGQATEDGPVSGPPLLPGICKYCRAQLIYQRHPSRWVSPYSGQPHHCPGWDRAIEAKAEKDR